MSGTRYTLTHWLIASYLILSVLLLSACSNSGGGSTAGAPVTLPVITTFQVSPAMVNRGESVNLTVEYSDGTGTVDNGIGPIPSGATIPILVNDDMTFQLTVVGMHGTVTASCSVKIYPPPLEIASFIADPAHVQAGSTATLKAVFSGGTGRVDPLIGAVTSGVGVSVGPITHSTTYTLTVVDSQGNQIQASTDITVISGSNTATSSLSIGRTGHTLTLLTDGTALVAGGRIGDWGFSLSALAPSSSCELYDPITKTFGPIAPMTIPRTNQTATSLKDGRVLIVGGESATNVIEIFNPSTGLFSAAGSLITARGEGHAATLLQDGRVLITGGWSGPSKFSDAEIYDPSTGLSKAVGPMQIGRSVHQAVLLASGKVLLAGGGATTAELFDPATERYSNVAAMKLARNGESAVVLPSGKVLFTGGTEAPGNPAELYDPATETFRFTGIPALIRSYGTATRLLNGKVLVAGGIQPGWKSSIYNVLSELYDPVAETFEPAGLVIDPNLERSAVRLEDGNVLMVGGRTTDSGGAYITHLSGTAEIYTPAP